MEVHEYLIDISVNEQTVHWCGHSQHEVEKPYLDYEGVLLKFNSEYLEQMIDPKWSPQEKNEVLTIDMEYLSVLQVKNRTLRHLVRNANQQLGLEDTQDAITFDFSEIDGKLKYFNEKALILAAVDEQERPFYSIPPHFSP